MVYEKKSRREDFLKEGNPLPRHVAIIMDGNGRWAQERGLPRVDGHRRGSDALETIVEAAAGMGIEFLTVYAFSSENWNRPEEEISGLVHLMCFYLQTETAKLHEQGIRLNILGDYHAFPDDVVFLIGEALELTRKNTRMTLNVALNYGGRPEIVRAAQRIAKRVAAGDLKPENITEDLFSRFLWTADIPDPEILIRTGGDYRLSNFLLWQVCYTECLFVEKYWPDFDKEDFKKALDAYRGKQRRFGAL